MPEYNCSLERAGIVLDNDPLIDFHDGMLKLFQGASEVAATVGMICSQVWLARNKK